MNLNKMLDEHSFSVELKSRESLKNIVLSDNIHEMVIIDGFLGRLEEIRFSEEILFIIKGEEGILRIDINEKEFTELIRVQSKKRLIENNGKEFQSEIEVNKI